VCKITKKTPFTMIISQFIWFCIRFALPLQAESIDETD